VWVGEYEFVAVGGGVEIGVGVGGGVEIGVAVGGKYGGLGVMWVLIVV
jgi:hypothetical protein